MILFEEIYGYFIYVCIAWCKAQLIKVEAPTLYHASGGAEAKLVEFITSIPAALHIIYLK